MPINRPADHPCAYGGYGKERARRGEANPCLASQHYKRGKGWQLREAATKVTKKALEKAGWREERVEAALAAVPFVNLSDAVCRNCVRARTKEALGWAVGRAKELELGLFNFIDGLAQEVEKIEAAKRAGAVSAGTFEGDPLWSSQGLDVEAQVRMLAKTGCGLGVACPARCDRHATDRFRSFNGYVICITDLPDALLLDVLARVEESSREGGLAFQAALGGTCRRMWRLLRATHQLAESRWAKRAVELQVASAAVATSAIRHACQPLSMPLSPALSVCPVLSALCLSSV